MVTCKGCVPVVPTLSLPTVLYVFYILIESIANLLLGLWIMVRLNESAECNPLLKRQFRQVCHTHSLHFLLESQFCLTLSDSWIFGNQDNEIHDLRLRCLQIMIKVIY